MQIIFLLWTTISWPICNYISVVVFLWVNAHAHTLQNIYPFSNFFPSFFMEVMGMSQMRLWREFLCSLFPSILTSWYHCKWNFGKIPTGALIRILVFVVFHCSTFSLLPITGFQPYEKLVQVDQCSMTSNIHQFFNNTRPFIPIEAQLRPILGTNLE